MASRKLRWRKDGRRNLSTEEALWQYMLDHITSIGPKGFVVCTVGITTWEDFLRSLQARKDGKYRWSEDDIRRIYKNTWSDLLVNK
jgi:hypothetical protein